MSGQVIAKLSATSLAVILQKHRGRGGGRGRGELPGKLHISPFSTFWELGGWKQSSAKADDQCGAMTLTSNDRGTISKTDGLADDE